MWFYEEDFDLVCEYSQYSPTAVRKKVMKAIKKMEKKYDDKRREKDMSSMSWKWVYKNSGIGGEQETNNKSMPTM